MNRMLKSDYVQRGVGGAVSLLTILSTPVFALLILVEVRNAARDHSSPPNLV